MSSSFAFPVPPKNLREILWWLILFTIDDINAIIKFIINVTIFRNNIWETSCWLCHCGEDRMGRGWGGGDGGGDSEDSWGSISHLMSTNHRLPQMSSFWDSAQCLSGFALSKPGVSFLKKKNQSQSRVGHQSNIQRAARGNISVRDKIFCQSPIPGWRSLTLCRPDFMRARLYASPMCTRFPGAEGPAEA